VELVPITISGAPSREVPALSDTAREALAGTAMLYREAGYEPPWIGYLVVSDGACVGTCAFKCAPKGGRVELAYFTFAGHEGLNASTRVLEKTGFRFESELDHPEDGRIWEWVLDPVTPRGPPSGASPS
jgi:hypothetical protein